MYTGVSGFDSSDILVGRPCGGCAILWRSDLYVEVRPIDTNSQYVQFVLLVIVSNYC